MMPYQMKRNTKVEKKWRQYMRQSLNPTPEEFMGMKKEQCPAGVAQ